MKATAHWLELKGHTAKSPSTIFDDVFAEQVIETGKIEDGLVVRNFLQRTGQPLLQDWLVEMVKRMIAHLPIQLLARMGLATVLRPHTKGWTGARNAIKEYVAEQDRHHRETLGLEALVAMAKREAAAPLSQAAE